MARPVLLRYDFGKGRVGKRHMVEFTLFNQGEVPATARFDAWQLVGSIQRRLS